MIRKDITNSIAFDNFTTLKLGAKGLYIKILLLRLQRMATTSFDMHHRVSLFEFFFFIHYVFPLLIISRSLSLDIVNILIFFLFFLNHILVAIPNLHCSFKPGLSEVKIFVSRDVTAGSMNVRRCCEAADSLFRSD